MTIKPLPPIVADRRREMVADPSVAAGRTMSCRCLLFGLLSVVPLLGILSCGQDPVLPEPKSNDSPVMVATVTVTPSLGRLVSIDETLQLVAVARTQSGSEISGRTFTWGSSDSSVVTVSGSGLVTAVANGTVSVTATTDGVVGSTTVEVRQEAAVLTFLAQPQRTDVDTPFASPIEVEALDALGTLVADSGAVVTLAIDPNPNGAALVGATSQVAVDGIASFPGLAVDAPGRELILSASADSVTVAVSEPFDILSGLPAVSVRFAQPALSISGLGTSIDVRLEADDNNGDPTDPPATSWASLNSGVVTTTSVDGTSGRLTALRSGQVTITATAGGLVDDALVTVTVPGPADPVTWGWQDFNSNVLYDVWVTSPGDVWAVGMAGTVLHHDGSEWSDASPDLPVWLRAVWASGPQEVWAAGLRTVLHYDGSRWSEVADAVLDSFSFVYDIWGSGPNDVWLAGSTSFGTMALVHFDGSSWTDWSAVTPDAEPALEAVWGTAPDDVWVVGKDGLVIRFDGTTWADAGAPVGTAAVVDVFGSGPDDVWVLTEYGAYHFDGVQWEDRSAGLTVTSTRRLKAGWASSTDVAWVTPINSWYLWYWNGTQWTSVTAPWEINGAESIHGTGPGDVWVVTHWGETTHYDGVGWSDQTQRLTTWTPTSLWASAVDDIWAGTSGEGILHFDGTSWSEAVGGFAGYLDGMWGSAADDIWAVGLSGRFMHYDGTSWSQVNDGLTSARLHDVWGSGPADIWVAGDDGSILRYDGTQWTNMPISVPVTALRGVYGFSAEDVWFVGENGSTGVVLHYDGQTVSDRSPPATASRLHGVWGTGPDDLWAVGDGDALLHFDGKIWVNVRPGESAYYTEVWGTGPEDVWALGGIFSCCSPASHKTLHHYNGSGWTTISLESLVQRNLHALWGTRNGPLWGLGGGGTLLRGSR